MSAVIDTRTPPRLPASDRRRQLLETALDFFSRKGFDGTTTKEIAAAAGVTEAIIFRHFPTKQALYNAVLDYHHESGELAAVHRRVQGLHGRATTTRASSAPSSNASSRRYRTDPRVHRVLLFAALEGHETGLAQHRQLTFPIFELLCQYVARRQSEGAIRDGNPGAIIAAIAGMATHYAMHDRRCSASASTRAIARWPTAFVDILMHGIQANATATQRAQ